MYRIRISGNVIRDELNSLWHLAHIHEKNLPGVSVVVFDGALLHEAVVAFLAGFCSACTKAI
jgi:hypothetical protein